MSRSTRQRAVELDDRAPPTRRRRDVRRPAVAAEADVDDVGRREEQRVRAAAVPVGHERDERRRPPSSARRPTAPAARRDTSGRSIGRTSIAVAPRGERLVAGLAQPVVQARLRWRIGRAPARERERADLVVRA